MPDHETTSTTESGGTPEIGGVRMMSAGVACDNDRCAVLVYSPDGSRAAGSPTRGCPSCGRDGFAVRFGVGIDQMCTPPAGGEG